MNVVKPFGVIASLEGLRLSLCDSNTDVAEALAKAFAGVAAVEVLAGDLLQLTCDAVVSPANSFGDMSGGIDKAIDDFHHGAAQRAVMEAIVRQFYGELPVGMAVVVEVPARRFPFIVAAPTMRIPGLVRRTINAYLSMRAVFVAVLRHNADGGTIRSVAVSAAWVARRLRSRCGRRMTTS